METVDAAAFDGARLKRDGDAIVLFFADWCGYCRRYLPVFEAWAAKHDVPCLVADASDDDTSPLWDDFDLKVVPSIAAFKDGALVAKRDGRRGWGLPEDAPAEMAAALRGLTST